MLYRTAVVLMAMFVILTGSAFADKVDFTRLSVNGVTPGDTVEHMQQVLGKPAAVKGTKKQFMLFGADGVKKPLTIELGTDGHVVFIENGSSLALAGKVVLQRGDAASGIDAALGGLEHEVREKVDSMDYAYYHAKTVLVIVTRDAKITGFVLGKRSY